MEKFYLLFKAGKGRIPQIQPCGRRINGSFKGLYIEAGVGKEMGGCWFL
jgi:hypothetical protein